MLEGRNEYVRERGWMVIAEEYQMEGRWEEG